MSVKNGKKISSKASKKEEDRVLEKTKIMSETDLSDSYDLREEITGVLGQGTEFEGRLVFEGVVRIDGKLKGEVFSRDTLVLGPESKVEAFIDADAVIVSGLFEGEIRASSRVEITATGSVRGIVVAPVFRIEEGGYFDGQTRMLQEDSPH